ncbi:hemerythrin domain-containing protein [Caballeronia sordidicola]|jgi:hemerythrin superfamily protein|uniref:Regulator of cell morphogenesis and NO signaling n=1 Tax=Caballeronia sordidicola TaxID=196367 RepID=A0A242N9A1_CABSO|nr:hemerythrin domain-containing protein [Caballeronia sordidicola]MDP9153472.1 hemerythrin domain-containing protein [Pseudomonadota bacterium]OTP80014.1 Regulator of cell morphogenesis and NO signaling [Caballeronia sordidicola]
MADTKKQDALTMLEEEHRAVEKLFEAFERADENDLERKATLVQRACELLTMHAIVEEEILYPAAKDALGKDDKDDVNEAYVEHFLVKTLIEKFTTMQAGDEGFDATFKVLTESVNHHVEEEESELFPELRKTKLDLKAMGEQIAKRHEALQNKITEVATSH